MRWELGIFKDAVTHGGLVLKHFCTQGEKTHRQNATVELRFGANGYYCVWARNWQMGRFSSVEARNVSFLRVIINHQFIESMPDCSGHKESPTALTSCQEICLKKVPGYVMDSLNNLEALPLSRHE